MISGLETGVPISDPVGILEALMSLEWRVTGLSKVAVDEDFTVGLLELFDLVIPGVAVVCTASANETVFCWLGEIDSLVSFKRHISRFSITMSDAILEIVYFAERHKIHFQKMSL
jgi:hypothetical protein